MEKILILLLCLIKSLYCDAQYNTISKPTYDSVIKVSVIPNGRYSSVIYTTFDGVPISKKGIEERLMLYEPSANEIVKYKTARRNVFIFGGIGVASAIIGGIENKHQRIGAAYPLLGVAVFGITLEIINSVRAHKHWNRSIELYNHHLGR